jgi:hypothetical protein
MRCASVYAATTQTCPRSRVLPCQLERQAGSPRDLRGLQEGGSGTGLLPCSRCRVPERQEQLAALVVLTRRRGLERGERKPVETHGFLIGEQLPGAAPRAPCVLHRLGGLPPGKAS